MVRARRQVEPDASHGITVTVVARGKCLCPFVCVKAKTTRARLAHIADERRLRLRLKGENEQNGEREQGPGGLCTRATQGGGRSRALLAT